MTEGMTVVLDTEFVTALQDQRHREHRTALEYVEGANARNRRRAGPVRVLIPTAVRVEAGWDRRAPAAAAINRLPIADHPLDGSATDRAAALRAALGVSVADAHLGAALTTTPGPHTVITSDVPDVERIAGELGIPVVVVRL